MLQTRMLRSHGFTSPFRTTIISYRVRAVSKRKMVLADREDVCRLRSEYSTFRMHRLLSAWFFIARPGDETFLVLQQCPGLSFLLLLTIANFFYPKKAYERLK